MMVAGFHTEFFGGGGEKNMCIDRAMPSREFGVMLPQEILEIYML